MDITERQDLTVNVSPAMMLVFAQVISNNIEGLEHHFREMFTDKGIDDLHHIIKELHEKSAEICFKDT